MESNKQDYYKIEWPKREKEIVILPVATKLCPYKTCLWCTCHIHKENYERKD